jgi:hypothetical protein
MPKVSRPSNYDKNVFINCPFDNLYEPLFHAIIFTLYDMGFKPKCAKDVSNAGQVRFTKIQDLIENCKYSIHDISRTQLDPVNSLPRFNMPLELGLDLGCRRYGTSHLQEKVILVLDVELHRYQKFISDIAGQDIDEHRSGEENVITVVRDWLRPELDPKVVKTPNGANIYTRYREFQAMLPSICADLGWDINKLPFIDFSWAVYDWISKNPIK